jgi:GxxExxY protein
VSDTTLRYSLEPSDDLDTLAADVLDAAINVHRILGPGFLESIYEQALCIELVDRGITFARQCGVSIQYKGQLIGEARIDLLIGNRLIVELKAVENIAPIHLAQTLSYLKATRLSLALLINFNAPILLRGVRRVVLSRP